VSASGGLRRVPPFPEIRAPSGEIARIVIPKSQGKQEYYDARKSAWGDLFPHDPKNGEVVRHRGIRRLKAVEGTSTPEDEKEEAAIGSLLRAMGVEGTKRRGGKERLSKLERREEHRQRKEWKKNEVRW
jgi:ribosomal protein RSM22 (predicted rRNA methylase)